MRILLYLLLAPLFVFAQGEQRYADGTATDQDGNTFEWINYGTQDWAIENAEVVNYRDGTSIPQVTDATEWQNLTTGAWCYYDNDPAKGKLYNWYAVAGIHDNDPNTPNKEFAPEGWHVPSGAEWTTLEDYLIANGYNFDGTTSGNKIAKSMSSTTEWENSYAQGEPGNNQSINNNSGFNSYPKGFFNSGDFLNRFIDAAFWAFNPEPTHYYILYRSVGLNSDNFNGRIKKNTGLSVRFIKDANSVGANGDILLNGTVSAENNQIKNVADPTEPQDAATKAYIDALIAEAIAGLQSQLDALQNSSSVTDINGNSYDYLTYGDQVWTVENAEMVTYRDGTPIPQVTDVTEWQNLTTGAWCYYDNDPTKGKLYNWYAAAGIHDNDPNTPNKELAPEGWHVPTDAEWKTLENYLIANGYNYDGTNTENKIAKAMASTSGWDIYNSNNGGVPSNDQSLNNSSGFNAYPKGGLGNLGYSDDPDKPGDGSAGGLACFWSTTMIYNDAYCYYLAYRRSDLARGINPEWQGFSVRFVRD
jgi:uncharacterized protein (TIGR02145 family)